MSGGTSCCNNSTIGIANQDNSPSVDPWGTPVIWVKKGQAVILLWSAGWLNVQGDLI